MNAVSILILVFGFAFVCREDSRAEPVVPTTAGRSWTIAYSPSMPQTLSAQHGAYVFDFPTSTDGIHYVIKSGPPVLAGQTITMVFALEGTGKLLPNEGRSPAKVRLFMQRRGDTLTAKEPYKRWWSLAHVELISPKTYKLSAKIEPSQWSSVFGAVGSSVPVEFADCIANLAHLGFTFGGDFAGHGVYAKSGRVRFVLKEYNVRSQTNPTSQRDAPAGGQ